MLLSWIAQPPNRVLIWKILRTHICSPWARSVEARCHCIAEAACMYVGSALGAHRLPYPASTPVAGIPVQGVLLITSQEPVDHSAPEEKSSSFSRNTQGQGHWLGRTVWYTRHCSTVKTYKIDECRARSFGANASELFVFNLCSPIGITDSRSLVAWSSEDGNQCMRSCRRRSVRVHGRAWSCIQDTYACIMCLARREAGPGPAVLTEIRRKLCSSVQCLCIQVNEDGEYRQRKVRK